MTSWLRISFKLGTKPGFRADEVATSLKPIVFGAEADG